MTGIERSGEPTMRDVAALAGVSIKTVSRVVNGEPGVRDGVVRRVEDATRSLGYRPNLSASNLRRADRRSATLGAVFEDLSNPFDAALLRAVEDRARESGVLVLAGSHEDDPARQRELLESLAARRVDGVVVMPTGGHQDVLQQERQRGMPMVLVDRPPTFADTDSVTTTNRTSAREAVLHLVHGGHRAIAFLGDRSSLWTARERHAGYVEGLARGGVQLAEELVRTDLHGMAAAKAATADLLDLAGAPTALFTAQNLVTLGALQVLKERGLRNEVAVVGFDDFLLADLLDPPVTVVRQDLPAIGRAAADMLFARIGGDDSPVAHAVVPAVFVRRGSGELPPART